MARPMPMWRRYLTFWGRHLRRDLDDEIEFHLQARTRELIDAGWTPGDARAEAARLFGDTRPVVAECLHIDGRIEQEKRMRRWLDDLAQDARSAVAQFRAQPKLWGAIALTVAAGVMASRSRLLLRIDNSDRRPSVAALP
jgi:putative ABC transport system permease protein